MLLLSVVALGDGCDDGGDVLMVALAVLPNLIELEENKVDKLEIREYFYCFHSIGVLELSLHMIIFV